MIRYAAIDIGSNAVRLLIAEIIQNGKSYTFKKNTLIRVPLRLGEDAFISQKLSDQKVIDLVKTMVAFRNLMDVYNVTKYLACATSAMREAKNSKEVIEKIKATAQINLEIIEGQREATIIYANHIEQTLDVNKSYLYIDVGGGSTELSVFVDKKLVAAKSFNIGTIRILDHQDKEETWNDMKDWVKAHKKGLKHLAGIGTGGNINKLFKMSGAKDDHPLSIMKLQKMYDELKSFSLEERISKLKLNQDRGDVIVPACTIYLTLMKWAGITQIYVPRVGMVDGIINLLIEENLGSSK